MSGPDLSGIHGTKMMRICPGRDSNQGSRGYRTGSKPLSCRCVTDRKGARSFKGRKARTSLTDCLTETRTPRTVAAADGRPRYGDEDLAEAVRARRCGVNEDVQESCTKTYRRERVE